MDVYNEWEKVAAVIKEDGVDEVEEAIDDIEEVYNSSSLNMEMTRSLTLSVKSTSRTGLKFRDDISTFGLVKSLRVVFFASEPRQSVVEWATPL